MTKRYTGGVVSSSLPTVNAAGASGVFLLSQQSDYQSRNAWPPYKIEESLRFRSSASAYLNKTFAAAGNRKTWTWSGWVKRGTLSTNQGLFACWIGAGSTRMWFGFLTSTNQITFYGQNGGSTIFDLQTTPVYRDPSAWYHLVLAVDTTQSTSSNRAKIYVNGVQVTAFSTSTYASQNTDTAINSADAHYLGSEVTTSTVFDGYMSEVNFVDGQALTPSSFGATDKDGNWSPIAYTGTYGTNGFYVNFRDNTSATTMGYDYSGNGNNWTLNNFNVSTANTTYDIMIDVPEDQDSANVRANYCTLNPVIAGTTNLINGNLTRNGSVRTNVGTMLLTGGKYYFETTIQDSNGNGGVGVKQSTAYPLESYDTSKCASYFANGEYKIEGGSQTSGFSSYTNGDVIGIAVDTTQSPAKIWFAKNNTWQGTGNPTTAGYSLTSGLEYYFMVLHGSGSSSTTASTNFGQRPFTYTPPTGFKSLNTFNLPEPTIKQPNKQFDAVIWSGDSSSPRNITSYNFQPDFSWIKCRSTGQYHIIQDAIRGTNLNSELSSGGTGAEGSFDSDLYGAVTSYLSNGFTVTAGSSNAAFVNLTGQTYVGWAWNAGNANTTNTSGSVTSIVRANPTAGFSIVTYTATAADPITVGHGLGVAPSMFMVKSRSASGTDWFVYHSSLGATKNLRLNTTAAAATATNVWNDTAPTSSVITTSNAINTNGITYVAYCFAPIAGYSAFGSYTGNGSTDGTFVYLGFRPRFVMVKRTDSTGAWVIWDSARDTYNVAEKGLLANSSNAEDTTNYIDFLSNGFKLRNTFGSQNGSGATYVYACWAENPFKYARSR